MGAMKSQTAFRFNVEQLFNLTKSGVYLWTCTFAEVLTVKEGSQRWSAFAKQMVSELKVFGVRVYELHDEHGLHIHWLADRFIPVQIVRRIAERHGFGRIHVERCGKWVADYLGKYLTKQGRPPCLKGKRLWAGFGDMQWSRVKDIVVRSWVGREYWRLRGDAMTVTRTESYGILRDAQRNYARWVERACGIQYWSPDAEVLPVATVGIPF